jgi:hypothetical protein
VMETYCPPQAPPESAQEERRSIYLFLSHSNQHIHAQNIASYRSGALKFTSPRGAYSVMLRINARLGQCSNRSEAISVARFHSIPPTLYGLGNWERGSRISSSSITGRGTKGGTKGRTTTVGACQQRVWIQEFYGEVRRPCFRRRRSCILLRATL